MIDESIKADDFTRNVQDVHHFLSTLNAEGCTSEEFTSDDHIDMTEVVFESGICDLKSLERCTEGLSKLRQFMSQKGYDTPEEKDSYCIAAMVLHGSKVFNLEEHSPRLVFEIVEKYKLAVQMNQVSFTTNQPS